MKFLGCFAGATMLALSAPAGAHGYLQSSFPAAKTHLLASPREFRLRFSVRDAQGAEIYAWNTVLEQSVLKPGERAAFRSRLASPPAEGRSIDVRFFTRRDIAGGSV